MNIIAAFNLIQMLKEDLHNEIIQLDAIQALELEIERLRGTSNVMKLMNDDGDTETWQNMEKSA